MGPPSGRRGEEPARSCVQVMSAELHGLEFGIRLIQRARGRAVAAWAL